VPDNVCTPYKDSSDITFRASAAVTGKRFVAPSGNRTGGPGLSTDLENLPVFAHAAAGARAFGVAAYDVPAGGRGPVHGEPGKIVPVRAGAAIAAGNEVEVGANGQAVPLAAGRPVGLAVSGAANGTDAEIRLY
jgi:hypothetical protein